MTVIAVVLNWNNEPDTAACLDSLVADGLPIAQVVLVDNASADGSGNRLHSRFPAARYLQTGANLGYAGGNNAGVREALAMGADWVLVLNNDTVIEPGMLHALMAAGESHSGVAAIAPKIVRFDDPTILWFDGGDFSRMRALGGHRGEGTRDRVPELRPAERVSFLTGCCLLLRSSAIAAMDEVFRSDFFLYIEDTELCVRLARGGWELWYVPAARLRHKVPPPGAAPPARHLQLRERNRRRLVRSHYGARDRLLFWLWFYPTRVVLVLGNLIRGDLPRAQAILKGSFEP
ncbi:MAG: glycosyltransferase family 2 protein [Gemmatimonadaceae bacterium]